MAASVMADPVAVRVPWLGFHGSGVGFAARHAAFAGDVAQLGEHLLCKQGVVGSIPIVSTRWASPPGASLVFLVSRRGFSVRCVGLCLGVAWGGSACRCGSWMGFLLKLYSGFVLFFLSVNQVLVRLWAREMGLCRGSWP
jgi:hypothetical protein